MCLGLAGCVLDNRLDLTAAGERADKGVVFMAIAASCPLPSVSLVARQGEDRRAINAMPGFFAVNGKSGLLQINLRDNVSVARFDIPPGTYQLERVDCYITNGQRLLQRPNSRNGIASFTVGPREILNLGTFHEAPVIRPVNSIFGNYQRHTGQMMFNFTPMSGEEMAKLREKYPEEAAKAVYRPMSMDQEHQREHAVTLCTMDALLKRNDSAKPSVEETNALIAACKQQGHVPRPASAEPGKTQKKAHRQS